MMTTLVNAHAITANDTIRCTNFEGTMYVESVDIRESGWVVIRGWITETGGHGYQQAWRLFGTTQVERRG